MNNPLRYIDPSGSLCYGVGLSLTESMALQLNGQIIMVWDDKLNFRNWKDHIGFLAIEAVGIVTNLGVSMETVTLWSNAELIHDLEGFGLTFGASIGFNLGPQKAPIPFQGSLLLTKSIGGDRRTTTISPGVGFSFEILGVDVAAGISLSHVQSVREAEANINYLATDVLPKAVKYTRAFSTDLAATLETIGSNAPLEQKIQAPVNSFEKWVILPFTRRVPGWIKAVGQLLTDLTDAL